MGSRARGRNHAIDVYCSQCRSHLYRYLKEGEGHLIKCYQSNILEDETKEPRHCPECSSEFAREAMIHGRPAYKIIQGKVFVR